MLLCTAKLKELKCNELAAIIGTPFVALGALVGIFFAIHDRNETAAFAVIGSILVVAVVAIVSFLIHFKYCKEIEEEESPNLSECNSKGVEGSSP